MPRSLHKVTKYIAKKKGPSAALHARSRDSKMLLRAGARDARVDKVAALREKVNKPYRTPSPPIVTGI
jgi:translation machinery-associated protein 16